MSKETEFVTTVEIPVRVFASAHDKEGDGWNEPHIPAHVDIDDIAVDLDFDAGIPEIIEYILLKNMPAFITEAEEYLKEDGGF